MAAYLIRRLLLIIPTLWAIITINFFIVQIAPGGPVDQAIANIEMGQSSGFGGGGAGEGLGTRGSASAAPRIASTGGRAGWIRK
ncbi:Inner membrane ABC transporter permease protein yejB [Serratia plymuthica]|uniref:Inner membrane ABC transporter permease protein yejB n=1 Tax=Serratia plymuthica TaxID=82996 RepID=A0A2X4V627_SERPL|nr:Inner membrane ABC transporter permease protein yejB [Serratia plymuthica]